jgi:hypothetical protein
MYFPMRQFSFPSIVLLTVLVTGCGFADAPSKQGHTAPTTSSVSTAPFIPARRMLLQFEPFACVCALGNVEMALLDIPAVETLDWEFDRNRVWLNFSKEARPTDDEIRRALQYQNVTLKKIYRP